MASPMQREFEDLMSDIYKLSATLSLDDQPLLQKWLRRLSLWGYRGEADTEKATTYAQYLLFQVQQSQLKFPFNAPPPEDDLPDLKDALYGRDEEGKPVLEDKLSSSLDTQSFPADKPASEDGDNNPYEDEHPAFETAHSFQPWDSILRPHTPDDGALLYAVVAEELAEWSARLAADQNMANRLAEEGDEEQWGARANERADYWSEVWTAWKSLNEEDERAGHHLGTDILRWLNQHRRQLQAEHAQLLALFKELEEIQTQIKQSKIWRDAKFHAQNRAMQAEILGTKERIAASERELKIVTGKVNSNITPKRPVTGSVGRQLSFSEESPNTSAPE